MDKMELFQYRYFPKNVVFTMGDEEFVFRDGSVTWINFVHDYHERRFPVIQFAIEMEVKLIAKLYENQDNVTVKFDIYEQKLKGDSADQEIVGTTLYMQHKFSIIPVYDMTAYISTDDEETLEEMDVLKTLQNLELYLVDMDIINWFTQEISVIYETDEEDPSVTPVTHAEALHAVFVERDIPDQIVVATPPLQNDVIDDVVIPLQDLVHNVYHLNNTYGLYDGVPIVYHDLFYLYCVAKKAPNIKIPSATDFGTIVFVLLNPTKPEHSITGSCDDIENEIHWVNMEEAPQIFDGTVRDTASKFSTITTINSKGEVNKTTLDEETTTLKYIYANNELTESQLLGEQMRGHTVSFVLKNTCAKFIKPYKDYLFTVESSYENLGLTGHVYRLERFTLGIHREGTDTYVTEQSLVLYKPTRDDDE